MSLYYHTLLSTVIRTGLTILYVCLICTHSWARETIPLKGLTDKVWAHIDERHTFYIFAHNDHDLFFMLGYLHAKDRWFQMDTLRRRFSGELAALLGENLLEEDIRNRMLGIKPAAKRSLALLPKTDIQVLESYRDGINTYLNTHPLPQEYQALNLSQARKWKVTDSLIIMKGITFLLSLNIDTERTQRLQNYLVKGIEKKFDGKKLYFIDTHPISPLSLHATLPAAGQAPPYQHVFHDQTPSTHKPQSYFFDNSFLQQLAALNNDLNNSSQLWQTFLSNGTQHVLGSNLWAVSGKHTKSQRPLVANDPHLKLTWPSLFFEAYLIIKKGPTQAPLNAFGAGFPGVPTLAHGQNQSILWASTNNPMDVSDIFLDTLVVNHPKCPIKATKNSPSLCIVSAGHYHPVEKTQETFYVNTLTPQKTDTIVEAQLPAEKTKRLTVPFRSFGPILKKLPAQIHNQKHSHQVLTLQYTGFHGTREISTFLGWLRTHSLTEFENHLQYFDTGSQNWIYTDTSGQLAYFTSAKIPLRKDLENGTIEGFGPAFIRDGSSGKENWVSAAASSKNPAHQRLPFMTLPWSEMPKLKNPSSGIIVNANNDPAGTTLDANPYNQTRSSNKQAIYYLNHSYSDGLRADRIAELLNELVTRKTPITAEHFKQIQLDHTQSDFNLLMPYLINACQHLCTNKSYFPKNGIYFQNLVSQLALWDGAAASGYENFTKLQTHTQQLSPSQLALWYNLWRAHLIRNTIYHTLDQYDLSHPPAPLALRSLVQLLKSEPFTAKGHSGLDFFTHQVSPKLPAKVRRDLILLKSLASLHSTLSSAHFKTHKERTKINTWTWGSLHRVYFEHPLGAAWSVPSAQIFAQWQTLGGIPLAGGYEVINAAPIAPDALDLNDFIVNHGPVRRFIGGPQKKWFQNRIHSFSTLAHGKQLPDWLNGHYTSIKANLKKPARHWALYKPDTDNQHE